MLYKLPVKFLGIVVTALCLSIPDGLGQSTATQSNASIESKVEALYTSPFDLVQLKLAVDNMVVPGQPTAAITSEIDAMVSAIVSLTGGATDSASKLAAMKRYLYEPGDWNGERPFQYDLDDPLGTKSENRLLRRYLATRRGNCITMPILFAAIGQRLGLIMTLAEAPLHVFVKYTDDAGKIWNLETTSGGGFTRDAWYRQKLPMSDRAVENGVYLRQLSQTQVTSLVASFLVEDRIGRGDFETAIAISDILLRHYPNFAYALVKKGTAYGAILRRELAGKYARVEDIPADLKERADRWYESNQIAFSRAEMLGWSSRDPMPD